MAVKKKWKSVARRTFLVLDSIGSRCWSYRGRRHLLLESGLGQCSPRDVHRHVRPGPRRGEARIASDKRQCRICLSKKRDDLG